MYCPRGYADAIAFYFKVKNDFFDKIYFSFKNPKQTLKNDKVIFFLLKKSKTNAPIWKK